MAEHSSPIPPILAPNHMTFPDGFNVTLFAGEPDVKQPIAIALDDRGRLWVAECYSYPNWSPTGNDRILIFEDTDHDGTFDTKKVFWDKGNYLTGFQLGFGGVWVASCPNLLFIPDKNQDDVPDGPPQVMLDGWSHQGVHTVINSLTWGPDGWLYGLNGIDSHSNVGRPGTPDDQRQKINCGVWRYHPTKKTFEVIAHGTTNPWGIDFDQHGQTFITNSVLPHLYHVIAGARFKRMHGKDFNPHAYKLMDTTADHLHWAGGSWTDSRGGLGDHGIAGGGHAHSGAMIYLADNFPEKYRNTFFTCNLHGRRVNNDSLKRKGSGYVATHNPDFLRVHDPWFNGIALKYGPDGAVYMTDWTEDGECHGHDAHRSSGRVYKITYQNPKPKIVNLAALSDDQLVKLHLHKSEWFVRRARRLLQERAILNKPNTAVHTALRDILNNDKDLIHKLRALWTLHATNGLTESIRSRLLDSPEEFIRAWTIQLELEDKIASPPMRKKLIHLAKTDPSPLVRLYLASSCTRVSPDLAWPIIEQLALHESDANDQNIPLILWYALEPLVPQNKQRAIKLAAKTKIPIIRQFIARRITAQ
ncbi:MAG: hypothetical protein IID32_07550 [Planctomycetes bacterium]|nr:hypothetical protein [Planctomycetota bacterium]